MRAWTPLPRESCRRRAHLCPAHSCQAFGTTLAAISDLCSSKTIARRSCVTNVITMASSSCSGSCDGSAATSRKFVSGNGRRSRSYCHRFRGSRGCLQLNRHTSSHCFCVTATTDPHKKRRIVLQLLRAFRAIRCVATDSPLYGAV